MLTPTPTADPTTMISAAAQAVIAISFFFDGYLSGEAFSSAGTADSGGGVGTAGVCEVCTGGGVTGGTAARCSEVLIEAVAV